MINSEEYELWFEKAEKDFEAAKYNFNGELFEYAAFFCQQAIEKALKALLLKNTGKIWKIHDLVKLGKLADLPIDLISYCKEITAAYIHTRYPDTVMSGEIEEESQKFLVWTEEILLWIKKHL